MDVGSTCVPPFQLATPPGLQVYHIPKGNLASYLLYHVIAFSHMIPTSLPGTKNDGNTWVSQSVHPTFELYWGTRYQEYCYGLRTAEE